MADHSHGHADDGRVHVHVHHWKFYAGILGALLFLTIITVAVSYIDIDGFLAMGREVEGVGAWNLTVAILIATMKASLVVLFFMHLRDDARFNGLVFIGGVLFVGVFLAYTMNDTATRGQTGDAFNGVVVDPETGVRAPGGIPGAIHGQELEAGLPQPEGAEEGAEPGEHSGAETAVEAALSDEEDDLQPEAQALEEEAEATEVIEGAAEEVVEEAAEVITAEETVDEEVGPAAAVADEEIAAPAAEDVEPRRAPAAAGAAAEAPEAPEASGAAE